MALVLTASGIGRSRSLGIYFALHANDHFLHVQPVSAGCSPRRDVSTSQKRDDPFQSVLEKLGRRTSANTTSCLRFLHAHEPPVSGDSLLLRILVYSVGG